MRRGHAEVVADDPNDGVPNLPQGQVGVPGVRVVRWEVGFRGVGQAQVGTQYVDAGLAQVAGGCVVGESGEGMHAAEADGGRVVAELGDGSGEAFGV